MTAPPSPMPASMLNPEAKKAPVLAVDDSPANLMALQAVAQHLDVELVTATSGAEALAACRERSYAVILLDVLMPGSDGLHTLVALRKLPTAKTTPVIFLTAVDLSRGLMQRAYELGAVDYIAKPFDVDAVRAKVRVFAAIYLQEQEIRRQAEALAVKDEHIAMLAHDLRNPLAVISMGAHVLTQHSDSSVTKTAARIHRAASQMERLTSDVLALAQAAEQKLEPMKAQADLGAVCTELLIDLAGSYPQIRLESRIEGSATGFFDARRVQQVVANLLSNAIKFGDGWISVRVGATETELFVEVANGGGTIPPEKLAILFDRFERAGEARPGTGLGLYIARLIARAHGGDVRARSEARRTTFTLHLPRVGRAAPSIS